MGNDALQKGSKMNVDSFLRQLSCQHCDWSRVWGPEEMLKRLQALGHLRRARELDTDCVLELFGASLDQIGCPDCGQAGLRMIQVSVDPDWGDVRACSSCRKPIPVERLEIFPDAERCAQCQDNPSKTLNEDDFCPRCGDVLRLVSSSTRGVTRYQSACSACGFKL